MRKFIIMALTIALASCAMTKDQQEKQQKSRECSQLMSDYLDAETKVMKGEMSMPEFEKKAQKVLKQCGKKK